MSADPGLTRNARRLELRKLNDPPTPPTLSTPLDPSLKRHSSLLVKLKQSLHQREQLAGIIKDLSSLSLEKYVEEAVGAVWEGTGKLRKAEEIYAVVDVVSLLHRRFPDRFTPPFLALLSGALKPSSSPPSASVATAATTGTEKEQRDKKILLRLSGELELCGISNEGVTFLALKDLLSNEKDPTVSAPIAIAFIKNLPVFLPSLSNGEVDYPTLQSSTPSGEEEELVSIREREKYGKLFNSYYASLSTKEIALQLDLQRLEARNHAAYITHGTIFTDRSKHYSTLVILREKSWSLLTQLSSLLGKSELKLPKLEKEGSGLVLGAGGGGGGRGERGEGEGVGERWSDEEEKDFYENTRDIRGEVPLAFLGVAPSNGNKEEAVPVQVEEPVKESEVEVEEDTEGKDLEKEKEVSERSIVTAPGPAAQLTSLLARLEEASSPTLIDSLAVEFAFLNSKSSRKRLIKFLAGVNRNRTDILPYYARFVKTLDPFMPDVAKELGALLEDEFRYFFKKRGDLFESRSKNIRFISELTKFSLLPSHSALHILKVLSDEFSSSAIETLSVLLESCGRFLLRNEVEATRESARTLLGNVKRKMEKVNLDSRLAMMLENAYYQCDPPDRPVAPPKERPPMLLYIRHLIYNVLSKNNSDRVLKQLRKLDWSDSFVVGKLKSAFTKVWKAKYSNIGLFAVLLYDLGKWHPEFSVHVIDDVLENVREGMETNSFKQNQMRVATLRYLGEMYNYRVLDSRVVFDTLWSLVTFGHPDGRPYPGEQNPIDAPDDFFRIRLVCVLLDTCGSCFERGVLRRKLDNFLVFFQMYVLSKERLPMDVSYMYEDTLETVRPGLQRETEWERARERVEEMLSANATQVEVPEEEEEEEREEDQEVVAAAEGDVVSSSSSETEDDSDSDEEATADEADTTVARHDPNAPTQEEDDDFTRELARMMTSTSGATSSTGASGAGGGGGGAAERKPTRLDVGVPYARRSRFDEEDGEEADGMRFTLLTKRGHKQQTRSMEIPRSSAIAIQTLEKRALDRAEQQELKRRVLDYEERQDAVEKQALKDQMARRGVNLRFVPAKPT